MGLSQTDKLFAALLGAFIIYVTVKGQLPAYFALFTSNTSSATPTTSSGSSGGSNGGSGGALLDALHISTPNVSPSTVSTVAELLATFGG